MVPILFTISAGNPYYGLGGYGGYGGLGGYGGFGGYGGLGGYGLPRLLPSIATPVEDKTA